MLIQIGQKAYDTVDWLFLEKVLEGLNFPVQFIRLIMSCLSTAMFSINVNGKPEGFFPGKRGMRQGDPISPYLFVIVMEYFSRLLMSLDQDREFKHHRGCKALRLTHLSFADDLMMFCKGDRNSAIKMKAVFDQFSAVSGLKANLDKSCIFFCGVAEEVKGHLAAQLKIPSVTLPVRYLGVPLIPGRLKARDCKPLVEKIRGKLQNWTTKYLSFAGRCQLLKSVIMHMQVYWSMAFMLPRAVMQEIEQMCNRFLWSGKIDKKAITMVAWKKVCLPKCEGGLGLKQMQNWNKAALCKYVWRLSSNAPGIWVRWCREQLLKEQSIWQVNEPNEIAWTWRKILQVRKYVQRHMWVQVGDGRQTSLFYHQWLNGESIVSLMRNETEIARWGGRLKVADWRRRGAWNIPVSFVRKYPNIVSKIFQFDIRSGPDDVQWKLSQCGKFSIASCYESIRHREEKVPWRNVVWTQSVFRRHGFLLWLAFQRRLKTKDLMRKKGVNSNMVCIFCNQTPETCTHLLFDC